MGHLLLKEHPALFFLLLVQVVNVFMFLGTMSLTALNRPKDAFWITVIAAIANILLDLVLIPVMGITGAAVATLIAMTLNALGALILLSRVISVKFEYGPVKNILYAAGMYGNFSSFHLFSPAPYTCNSCFSYGYHWSSNLPICFT